MKKTFLLLLSIVALAAFLRFFNLANNPPSPYWEEAALGFDAYSILKTGKDFHGNNWPLVAFESFGDWKPSLYFYFTAVSEAVFGLNTFAVRFPSALLGSLTIALVYLFCKELLGRDEVALLSAFLLAVSPWHLQVSRVGFEANLGLFLVVLGAYFFIKGMRRGWYLVLGTAIWGLSLYAYHAEKIFVPFLGLILGLWFLKKLLRVKKWAVLAIVVFILTITPILLELKNPDITKRFAETSVLATQEPVLESNRLIREDGNTRIAKLVHHRFWHYEKLLVNNYLKHFDFSYLFLNGDANVRHSIQLAGSLYLIQFPFLILGIFFTFRKRKWALAPLFIWLFLAPFPAALTKAAPHSLRSLPMVIPLMILCAYGAVQLIDQIKAKYFQVCCLTVLVILFIEIGRYLYIYHKDYPYDSSQYWQYGYQEMIEYVEENKDEYDQIYISRNLGRPSIYYWFFTQTDPKKVQSLNNRVSKDQGEYLEFENIKFGNPPETFPENTKVLIISQEENKDMGKLLKKVYNLRHGIAFNIYEKI